MLKSHFAVALERKDKVGLSILFEIHHRLGSAVPGVGEHIPKGQLFLLALRHHLAQRRVLARGTDALLLARLFVGLPRGLFDQLESHGQRGFCPMIEAGQEVDAFDAAVEAVIPVPADQFACIGVELFFDTVVEDQDGVLTLEGTYQRLDHLPQVGGGEIASRQEACDLVVADRSVKQGGKPGGCGHAKRAEQIVGIDIEQVFVHDEIIPAITFSDYLTA